MSANIPENPRARRRLLSHCALIGRAVKRHVPAKHRLESAVGREQARSLVQALTGS